MRTDTHPIQITIEDLRIDPEGTIRSLPEAGEAVIVSADGTILAMLAPVAPAPSLTPKQLAEIRLAIANFERRDRSTLIDHAEAMRVFDDDESVPDEG